MDQLQALLRSRGYARATVTFYMQAAVHFSIWHARKGSTPNDIDEESVNRFLQGHLRHCRCMFAGIRGFGSVRAALRHLLRILGIECRNSPRESSASFIEEEVEKFDLFLRDTCGLREATRAYRRRYVRRYLSTVYGNGTIGVSHLSATELVRFVSSRAQCLQPGSAQVLASSLRSYIRFNQLQGKCDGLLAGAIPRVPRWRLSHLPKVLSDKQLSTLLTAFDLRTAIGKRDHAMICCMIDLGLRPSDVAGLELDNLDWRAGSIRIDTAKSRRDHLLPLSARVARAISRYLRRGRPVTGERTIFVRHRPPVGARITTAIVCNALRYAAARAGLIGIINCTRVLRQTAASRMLAGGASLKEIADILHHRCIDTTAIYTKIDVRRLAEVAMPWPSLKR